MATISKIRAEFDARQATEAMYALSERARFLNKLLAEQRKRWEETNDPKVKDAIDSSIKRLEAEVAAVEKLNNSIQKSINTESAFQQVLEGKTSGMSQARLTSAQRNAQAIMRNINPQDENAVDQMDEAQRVMNAAGKQIASLKNGFMDAMRTVEDGVEGKALPELKRLEAALTEAQKFSTDQGEWQKYEEAISKVRLEMQQASIVAIELEEKNGKAAASLKYGFEDAFKTFEEGIENMTLPQLKRLEASLTETQKFSADAEEWQKYGAAIDTVRQKIQGITGEYLSIGDAMKYGEQIEKQTFTGTIADLERAKKLLTDYRKTIKQTADGGAELKKIDDNLEIIDQQIKGTYLTTQKFNEILNHPKGKSFDELKQAVEKAEKQLYSMRRTTDEEREAFLKLKEQIDGAKEELKDFGEAQEDAGIGMDELKEKAKQLAGAYLGLQSLQKVFELNLDLSDQMAAVRKTTGFTEEQVARLNDRIKAIDTRAANEQLMSLAATAGQLGLSTEEDVLGFTKAANQITVSLDELGTDGVLQLMKVAQVSGALAQEGGDVEQTLLKVGSAINELSAASSATAGPITDFIGRVGGVASTAKMTMKQIAALGATTDALAISAELAGTQVNIFLGGMQKNTKAVADLLGMTKESVQAMIDNGQTMELFVATMEKLGTLDANKMEDFLKEMGSSGSRATQVFSTLSQHVDQLRANLAVANQAYEEGMSITEEYNKVNDTAAGKFERLKNSIQEAFVSDSVQKSLGWMIDRLRDVVNLLTGNVAPALDLVGILLKTLLIRWAVVKMEIGKALLISLPKAIVGLKTLTVTAFTTMGTQIKAAAFYMGLHTMATKRAAVAMRQLNAAQMANFWVALAVAIAYAAKALYDWTQRVSNTVSALAEAEKKLAENTREANNLFGQYKKLSEKQVELTKSTNSLREKEKKLKEETEALRKKMGEGAEKSEEYRKKQNELEEAHKEVAKAEGEASKATGERLGLINEINSKYSTYLGYMLSEVSTAETVASAHNLIIAALKEEMYWREKNNAFKTVTEQHSEDLNKYIKKSLAEMNGIDETRQQKIMSAWQAQLSQVTYDASQGGFTLTPGGRAYATVDQALEGMKERFNTVLVTEGGYYMVHTDDKKDRLNDWWGGGLDDGFKDWTEESLKILKEASMLQSMSGSAATKAHEAVVREAQANTDALISQAQERGDKVSNKQLAEAVVGIQKNLSRYGELSNQYQQFASDTSLQGIANVLLKDLPEETRKAIEKEMQRVAANGINQPTPTVPTITPQGSSSTSRVPSNYNDMSGDDLVKRRKEMLERVKALANGADVQAVLSEDAKFISEAVRKNIKTTEQAIEWYNSERLKIQDALHAKHLTNTGDWMDPEKVRKRFSRVVQDEMKYYLDELDAYYTERNQMIQQKRNDEEITEGEAWLQTIRNETEWYQRRAELQKLYADKSKEVTEQEQQAIFGIISERTGETVKYIKANVAQTVKLIDDVGQKSKEAMKRIKGDIDLGTEKDELKSAKAVGKSVKFMADTLAKERPLNGIVDDLQTTLAKMGILEGQVPEKMRVLIGEIENAYSTDVKGLVDRISAAGFTEWAKQIEGDTTVQQALIAQLRKAYEAVQDAIRKEASRIKKDADMMWKTILLPDGTSLKQATDEVLARMTQQQDSVSRANSLIGAGVASENVATKLAIKQLQLQMSIQRAQFALMRKIGNEKAQYLDQLAKELELSGKLTDAERARKDAANVRKSLELAVTEETKKQQELSNQIAKEQEEAQNRLYTELREWGDLLASSLKDIFEASAAGNEEYYNELAKLNLTGKGGPGAGTYVVIDNAGTSDAKAHYEYLDERQALERQHEIEQENARAEAWKKVWDDLNQKMNDTITDQINAMLQNASVDANTTALNTLTGAVNNLAGVMGGTATGDYARNAEGMAVDSSGNAVYPVQPTAPTTEQPAEGGAPVSYWPMSEEHKEQIAGWNNELWQRYGEAVIETMQTMADATAGMPSAVTDPFVTSPEQVEQIAENSAAAADAQANAKIAASDREAQAVLANQQKLRQGEQQTDQQMTKSAGNMYAKMTQAANLYGIAYQTMSNDNLSTSQKFQMMAVQSAGQAAIAMLTTNWAKDQGQVAGSLPAILAECLKINPIAGAAIFAVLTGLLGGLMGVAVSKITKHKSEIAQATGTSGASAGKLATGMLTYAEGNVNEFTDPASLTPGRQYNVDAADGKTYRARYMGKNPKTHITNGPEFHLAGEAGREMIIDAGTTRQITMNEGEIWHTIQTLSNGGRGYSLRRSAGRSGIRAFKDGNVDDFDFTTEGAEGTDGTGMNGMTADQLLAFQASLDRNSAIMERLAEEGIEAFVSPYGKRGIVNGYDHYKKEAQRQGVKY